MLLVPLLLLLGQRQRRGGCLRDFVLAGLQRLHGAAVGRPPRRRGSPAARGCGPVQREQAAQRGIRAARPAWPLLLLTAGGRRSCRSRTCMLLHWLLLRRGRLHVKPTCKLRTRRLLRVLPLGRLQRPRGQAACEGARTLLRQQLLCTRLLLQHAPSRLLLHMPLLRPVLLQVRRLRHGDDAARGAVLEVRQ